MMETYIVIITLVAGQLLGMVIALWKDLNKLRNN